jgi:hypothetical protein
LQRRLVFVIRNATMLWHSHVNMIKTLRSIGQIVHARSIHNLLLRMIWSWRWNISYRQLGLEKIATRRVKLQLFQAFSTMRAAVRPSRSWLMDRYQSHILLSNVLVQWAAVSTLSTTICALVHRHYTFPYIIAWKRVSKRSTLIRRMLMRRSYSRWLTLVTRCHFIRVSAHALCRHSSARSLGAAFHAWRGRRMQERVEEQPQLRLAVLTWLRRTRTTVRAKALYKRLKYRDMQKAFKLWRALAESVRLAPVIKAYTYAAAASRRAAINMAPSFPALSPGSSRAAHIPWRS